MIKQKCTLQLTLLRTALTQKANASFETKRVNNCEVSRQGDNRPCVGGGVLPPTGERNNCSATFSEQTLVLWSQRTNKKLDFKCPARLC